MDGSAESKPIDRAIANRMQYSELNLSIFVEADKQTLLRMVAMTGAHYQLSTNIAIGKPISILMKVKIVAG